MVGGHTLQGNLVGDGALWAGTFREWFESGRPYSELDSLSGHVWPVFHEWLAHPDRDAYWDRYNPTPEQYAKLSLPILTITGSYGLHVDWYRWTMSGGSKPEFLKQHVAYYVMGADQWKYAESLDGVTKDHRSLYLDSDGKANEVFHSGSLRDSGRDGLFDSYVYDPRDTAIARAEEKVDARMAQRFY